MSPFGSLETLHGLPTVPSPLLVIVLSSIRLLPIPVKKSMPEALLPVTRFRVRIRSPELSLSRPSETSEVEPASRISFSVIIHDGKPPPGDVANRVRRAELIVQPIRFPWTTPVLSKESNPDNEVRSPAAGAEKSSAPLPTIESSTVTFETPALQSPNRRSADF